jgi:hypothetical protein
VVALVSSRPPSLRAAPLLRELPAPARLVDSLWQRDNLRGGEGIGRFDRRSCLAGVLLVDTRVALAANDPGKARSPLARLARVMEETGQLESEAAVLAGVASAMQAGERPAALVGRLGRIERPLEERMLEGWLDLGRFAEAARLAAVARSTDFFAARATRRRLERLRRPQSGLDRGIVESLHEIRAYCDSPPADAAEWAALSSRLEALLVEATP